MMENDLQSGLDKLLSWLRKSQRNIDIFHEPVFDELSTPVTTLNTWNASVVENATTAIPVVHNSGDPKSSVMKDVLIFVVILVLCCVNALVAYGIRRSRKSKREADEEEGGIPRCQKDWGNNKYECTFWLPELVGNHSIKPQGFVTLSESGHIIDVKYWSHQELDEWFRGKCHMKMAGNRP